MRGMCGGFSDAAISCEAQVRREATGPLRGSRRKKIMQFSSNCKGKTPILSKFWAQGPPDQNPGSGPGAPLKRVSGQGVRSWIFRCSACAAELSNSALRLIEKRIFQPIPSNLYGFSKCVDLLFCSHLATTPSPPAKCHMGQVNTVEFPRVQAASQ